MPSRRARSSAFGKGETQDGGKKAGKEKPTTDEAGGKGLESEAASASQEIDVSFGARGVDSGTGPGVSVGAGVDAVDRISLVSGSAHGGLVWSGKACSVAAGWVGREIVGELGAGI